MPVRVVKVGGSLFDWPDFKPQLQNWLNSVGQSRLVVFPGGGKFVDKVRRWQRAKGWTDERAHDRALDMLMIVSRLMKNWLPDSYWTNDPGQINSGSSRIVVWDCSLWAKKLSGIPQNWNLTSDSLAAILAAQLDAAELVLLKSRLPETNDPTQDGNLVDPLLKTYAKTPVRIVNLRCPTFSECVLLRRHLAIGEQSS